MGFKLEQLPYQEKAIQSVVDVFQGQEKNTFDNACHFGIRSKIKRIEESGKLLGIGVEDHIIIAYDSYESFRECGTM